MKIVIVGGTTQAEFLIGMFKNKDNTLVVINPDRDFSDTLTKRCHMPVYYGEPWKRYVLEEAGAYDADVFVALCEKDTDNFASCLLASKVFNAKKCICVVSNPKNVELYKKLGIDSVISSTYLLGQSIRGESTMESLTKTLSLDNDKIVVIESTVLAKHEICNKKIMEIHFPKYASIAAITRGYQILIPNGQIELRPKDVLMVVTAPENQKKLLAYLQKDIDASVLERMASKAEKLVATAKAEFEKKTKANSDSEAK